MRALRNLLLVVTMGMTGLGCGSDTASARAPDVPDDRTPPDLPPTREPLIVESDIYKLAPPYLYVQNAQTGLNILNVANSAKPILVGRTSVTSGSAGELYVRDSQAIVLLKTASASCRCVQNLQQDSWSWGAEVVFVDVGDKTRPQPIERWCLPGELVSSRLVDNVLYVVTTHTAGGSRAYSLDVTDARNPVMLQRMEFPEASKEILVTAEAIFVAGSTLSSYEQKTRVQYIEITAEGKMTARGAALLKGEPQGRFHMDARDGQFRIVTYESGIQKSRLSILDVSNPDDLRLIGQLPGIGYGEKLYATRFDGDRVYVVTYRQTDPLWIISLQNPAAPQIVGELVVPGWSDFIFPRGNQLITVGRGDRGSYLGVSLFDVTNPQYPRTLSQVSLGSPDSTSEANVDHRAVTILDQPGMLPMIVVPHTAVRYGSTYGGCSVGDEITLIDVNASSLRVRGGVAQRGTVYRTLLFYTYLYSISDYEILSVDFSDRDAPRVQSTVTVGQTVSTSSEYSSYCEKWQTWDTDRRNYVERDYDYHSHDMFICTVGEGAPVGWPPAVMVLGLIWLAATRLRRRAGR